MTAQPGDRIPYQFAQLSCGECHRLQAVVRNTWSVCPTLCGVLLDKLDDAKIAAARGALPDDGLLPWPEMSDKEYRTVHQRLWSALTLYNGSPAYLERFLLSVFELDLPRV